jgi:3-oxoadipate enol-lactonase
VFVRTDGALHFVRLTGKADAPPVVFANSLGSDLRIWDQVADGLGPDMRVVRYDMRGHGLTDAPAPPFSLLELARDLGQILEAVRVRRAAICGVSVGAMVALQLAARQPHLVEGLVLCDTGTSIGTRESWNQRIGDVERGGLAAIAGAVMARWFTSDYRTQQPEQVAGYRYMLERTTPAGYVGVAAALRDANLEAEARAVRCPTLVLCGDHDEATPPALNRSLASAIPGARFELVTAAGHLPCIEQPDAVAGHIRAFVRSHTHA